MTASNQIFQQVQSKLRQIMASANRVIQEGDDDPIDLVYYTYLVTQITYIVGQLNDLRRLVNQFQALRRG